MDELSRLAAGRSASRGDGKATGWIPAGATGQDQMTSALDIDKSNIMGELNICH